MAAHLSHLGSDALARDEAADDGERQGIAAANARQLYRLLIADLLPARLQTQQRHRIILRQAGQVQLQRSLQAASKLAATYNQEPHAPPLQRPPGRVETAPPTNQETMLAWLGAVLLSGCERQELLSASTRRNPTCISSTTDRARQHLNVRRGLTHTPYFQSKAARSRPAAGATPRHLPNPAAAAAACCCCCCLLL